MVILRDAFADGVVFVDLAAIRDPNLVIATIAQTLGVTDGAARSLSATVCAALRGRQILLLLDNFEQVVTAATEVADLLAACPQLKVLITSRAVLHLAGEHEWVVSPLQLPDPQQGLDPTKRELLLYWYGFTTARGPLPLGSGGSAGPPVLS